MNRSFEFFQQYCIIGRGFIIKWFYSATISKLAKSRVRVFTTNSQPSYEEGYEHMRKASKISTAWKDRDVVNFPPKQMFNASKEVSETRYWTPPLERYFIWNLKFFSNILSVGWTLQIPHSYFEKINTPNEHIIAHFEYFFYLSL